MYSEYYLVIRIYTDTRKISSSFPGIPQSVCMYKQVRQEVDV